jgi:hypothetical protein
MLHCVSFFVKLLKIFNKGNIMKKSLLAVMVMSAIGSASANTNCVESIKAAINVNAKYVSDNYIPEGQKRGQQQQQQQQQQHSPDEMTFERFVLELRNFKYEVKKGFRDLGRLSQAQSNVKYYNSLLKVEEENFSQKDARIAAGSKGAMDLTQFKAKGYSVCISEAKLHDKISELADVNQAYESFIGDIYSNKYDKMSFNEITSISLDHANDQYDVLGQFEKVMPGSADRYKYGQKYMDLDENDSLTINPMRVMTKIQLKRAVKRY